MASASLINSRYEVVRRLGEGSEAEIYLVRNINEHDNEYIRLCHFNTNF